MPTPSFSPADRFRTLYTYECDCNAKSLQMLQSVPESSRSDPNFARAVGKLAHLVAARHNWLHRLGLLASAVDWFPPTTIDQLPAALRDIEDRWTRYLALRLTDADLAAEFDYTGYDGKRRRWRLLDLLTQLFGHAWYHRGQIALLVKDLGGQPVDTDFIFWTRPTLLDEPA